LFIQGLLDRLKEGGGGVVVAEGYVREFERRGYLSAGVFVPVVVLEHPDMVKRMHEEFVHAGSDVVLAFTYYGHRDKLRHIGREDELEKLNRTALKMAREVADKTGTLMAGLPAVITMTAYIPDVTTDDVPFPEACRKLEEAGAAVVGLNCGRGPATMLPLIKEIRKECKGPVAAVPVPYRCTDESRTFQSLKDPVTGERLYPTNISCFECNRSDIRKFAEEAKNIGVKYIGVCCGNNGGLTREVAQVYGRKPEACKYSPDISLSCVFGESSKEEKYSRSSKIRDFMIKGN
ncbi:hypothetical protein FSP39_024758, partial [Pinctada imbricata]